MKYRIALLLLIGLAGLSGQGPVTTQVTVPSPDVQYQVDGQWFRGSAAFTWPAGSKHLLSIQAWQYGLNTLENTRYAFQHWNSAAGELGSGSNQVIVTADAAIGWYSPVLQLAYAISLRFFRCGADVCSPPGTVWVNQIAYQQDADLWAEAGSTVFLDAAPGPGYVFAGWTQNGSAPLWSFVINAPVVLYPRFAIARAIQLHTVPDGLQLLADGAPVSTPVTLEWGWNTAHTVAAVSPTADLGGRAWVFQSWSDGGQPAHTYQVDPSPAAATLVATFLPRVAATLLTVPVGLNLTVDGQDAATPLNLSWASGQNHSLTAPLRQTDASGTPWVFREWSNGAANAQTIAVADSQAATGIRLTATYDPRSRILLTSTPSGMALSVDGGACRTPCEVERSVGSTVALVAPASVPDGDGVRLDFSGWQGTAGPSLTAVAGIMRIAALYRTSYRLSLNSQPATAVSWRVAPASADGFYAAGTAVAVGLDAASGMTFHGWTGDWSGAANPASVIMNGPHAATAVFDPAPAAPPAPKVGNAAGDTGLAAVAPGSIASLFGSGLTNRTESGPPGPLRQMLAGVTLLCQGRPPGLLYAGPQQVNFQVPGDLAPGTYSLEIDRDSGPPLKVPFTVARHAPGLFFAAHLDGSVIDADSPAHPGETAILYGTGFGPYQTPLLDGFPAPAAPPDWLVDEVSVSIQDLAATPEFAGAVPGAVGVAMIRVRIPPEAAPGPDSRIRVTAGGIESNFLPLPLIP